MSDPNGELQVQRRLQTQQAPQQFSEAEMLLRNMEDNVGIKRKGDVAQLQDKKHGIKKDTFSFIRWLWGGVRGRKTVARLTKEERRETRSDVQRLEVKTRLGAIADRYARDRDVKRNTELLDIIKQIKEYSKLDTLAVKHKENLKTESDLYKEICKSLEKFVLSECMKHESNTGKLVDIGVRLHTFFNIRGSGSMTIPQSPPAQIIDDEVRAPMFTRKFNNIVYEDFSTKGELMEENAEKEPLFPHEPSVNDIKQNQLGDCYFLAALSTIVNQNPQSIKDCMKDDGHHVYVRFYTKTANNTYSPVYVKTEKRIPKRRNGQDPFAGGALWVQMMERAYANVRSKYITGVDRFGYTEPPATDPVAER